MELTAGLRLTPAGAKVLADCPDLKLLDALDVSRNALTPAGIAALRKMADDYYTWRNENYPVGSSDSGLHTWDDRLTDYSAAKIAERAQHVRKLLDQVRALGAVAGELGERV